MAGQILPAQLHVDNALPARPSEAIARSVWRPKSPLPTLGIAPAQILDTSEELRVTRQANSARAARRATVRLISRA
jgi:hypothetical protein